MSTHKRKSFVVSAHEEELFNRVRARKLSWSDKTMGRVAHELLQHAILEELGDNYTVANGDDYDGTP